MEERIKSIFEIARGMSDKEISEKYGITEDEVNAIKCMNPEVVESLRITIPTKEFYEDLQYLVDDFAKLKSTIVYKESITPETVAIVMENYEEKLQRFQKRYGNIEK